LFDNPAKNLGSEGQRNQSWFARLSVLWQCLFLPDTKSRSCWIISSSLTYELIETFESDVVVYKEDGRWKMTILYCSSRIMLRAVLNNLTSSRLEPPSGSSLNYY
jgi:hypothetical protein